MTTSMEDNTGWIDVWDHTLLEIAWVTDRRKEVKREDIEVMGEVRLMVVTVARW